MGLFNFKKKQELPISGGEEIPHPPDFDLSKDLPQLSKETPEFPPIPEAPDIEKPIKAPEMPPVPDSQEMKQEPATQMPVREEAPRLQREDILPKHSAEGPIFARVDYYKSILEDSKVIQSNLKEADTILSGLTELKNEEDKTFEKWRIQLEDIQRKLNYVDNLIFTSR